LGNAGRGSGLTLFGDRTVGAGASRASGLLDGGGASGGGEGDGTGTDTDTCAGSNTTFAVTSGGATNAGASVTGALVTIGVGTRCVVEPLGPGATSPGPGHDWITATAPVSATITATTGNGHHRRARGTGSAAGSSVIGSASIGSKR
jgi:hypothetical protein